MSIDVESNDPQPTHKPRRWRRRLKIAGITLFLLAIGLRIVMALALPAVISRVAAFYDLDIKCDRESLAIMGGHMALSGVKVYPRGGDEPILAAEYVHGEILPWRLLGGKLHILRAEADGVDLLVQRTADGHVPFLEKIASHATTQPGPNAPQPSQFDFTSPLVVEALRLNKVRARVRDDAVSPPLDASVTMDLRVSHLGAPQGTPSQFEVDAWGDRVLDSLRIEGAAAGAGRNLDATAKLYLHGLHAKPLAGYLVPRGLKPIADSIGVEATATLLARPSPASSSAISASCTIDNVRATADDQDFATLSSIKIDADNVDPEAARITSVAISRGRFLAARDAAGAMRIAGFEWVPPTATRSSDASALRISLAPAQVKLHDLQANFHDAATDPPVELNAILTDLSIRPRAQGEATDVAGSIALPGVARSVRIDGVIQPAPGKQSAQLSLHAEGIRGDSLKPYLAAWGIESHLKDAQLTGSLHVDVASDSQGRMSGSAMLRDVRFTDESELLALGAADLTGVRIDPANARWRIDAIDMTGPSLSITREPGGGIDALGVQFGSAKTPIRNIAPTTALAIRSATAGLNRPLNLPGIDLGRLTWKGVRINLIDRATPGAGSLSIDDAGVEIKDLLLDLSAKAGAEKAGTIHAWIKSPQMLADGLNIQGTLTPGPQSLAADVKIDAPHLQTTPLKPYLAPAGIEPTLSDGALTLHAKLGLIGGFDGSITSWLDLADLSLRQGDEELLAVDSLTVDSMTFKPRQIDIGQVSIRNPRANATREPGGAIVAGGARIQPNHHLPVAMKPPALPALNNPAMTSPADFETADSSSLESAITASSSPSFACTLKSLSIENAQLHWLDQAANPPVSTTGFVTASVNDLTIGRHAPAATFSLQFSSEGILDDLKIEGEQLDPTPGAELVKMNVAASGIRGAPIDGYLPPGVASDVADGRFRATILASRLHGVRSAYLDLINVDWRDGESSPLLSCDLARLAASRIDWFGDAVNIEEISLNNFESNASIDVAGRAHAFGLVLGKAPNAAPNSSSDFSHSTQPASTQPASTQPSAAPVADDPPTAAQDVARPLPAMVLNKLDLDIRKFALRDDRHPGGKPIAINDLRLRNTAPITLGGQYADAQPPAHLVLSGSIDPLVKQFSLTIDTAPFAPEPVVTFELSATGIRGAGLTDIYPNLAGSIDGGGMIDGRFHAWAQLHAKFNHRGPRDFDLSRGFDLDLNAKDISFRDRDIGRVLAGVDQIAADTIHVDPARQSVQIKSLEISTPIAYAAREVDGVHAMGLVLKLPTGYAQSNATTQPGDQAATRASAVIAADISPGAAASRAATRPTGELRIDRLQISGMDVRMEDRAVDPPLIVPVRSLDLEVRDLSSSSLFEDKPIRFNAIMESSKGAPQQVAGTNPSTTQTSELRELFSQISVSGSVSLYPAPHGYTKTSINGLDLSAFRGEAGAGGVDLAGGILDADVNTRFSDEGSLDLRSKFVFTDLRLTEPANGPIQRYLALSAPLDVVIGAVRDPDGGITIPLNVPIEKFSVSTGSVVGAATSALAQILVTAVASAPVKAIGGIGDVIGLGGGQKTVQAALARVPFKPGDASLSQSASQEINRLIDRLRKDRNAQATLRSELSQEDARVANARANPSAQDCLALAEKLRTDRAKMASDRLALAARATAELASSSASAAQTGEQLRDLDRRISQTDEAMDHLYDMLRPGAANQATRRARAAMLQIAELRLKNVYDALLAANIPQASERIQKTPATDKRIEGGEDGAVAVTVVQRKRQK